ncbi:hypothetical protein AB6A40_005382 [Gnathostoma spinigerum]|uniref:Uncharacterized protein n=1 Tax=Gnathostoma spinigerum TaxID=75299 RepID=A0ABD6ENV8_9BILA
MRYKFWRRLLALGKTRKLCDNKSLLKKEANAKRTWLESNVKDKQEIDYVLVDTSNSYRALTAKIIDKNAQEMASKRQDKRDFDETRLAASDRKRDKRMLNENEGN